MDWLLIAGFLASGVRFMMPILFAALGETVGQRAGVLNVGLEGIMLVGALLAVIVSVETGTPWAGLLAAIAGGMAMGLLHGLFCVVLKADQIVAGIALILLGLGLSGFGYRLYTADGAALQVPGFAAVELGALSSLPVIGPVLFAQPALVYLGIVAALALAWLFARTGLGLTIRAVGENPKAADAAGVDVDRVRLWASAFCGAMAGIGGAFLSTAQLAGFVENMVSGRGFIAIACVVFARWNPLGVLAVALGFGLAEAAQIRLQALYPGIPYQAFVLLPYLIALIGLAAAARAAHLPAALARPYRKD